MDWAGIHFWAKTTEDGQPGISVRDHCLNVGCVAEALIIGILDSTAVPTGRITILLRFACC